ncbi:tripartite motif-containing protein 56 [Plakobranchus ocellatus]|uniref:Tripartite motif-containing protein 56 n=1 Tax=Plakobranchus ocellatus TaxID=259542 RepID=A0AAV4DAA5_9GAST|nr:tripartite motif-containing protein 56 [Plakobranchus ocellatus]
MNLKKQQEKLERRVISEKQEVQNNFSSIEKKMKKNNLRLRENIAQLESNNKAHVEELSTVVKTNENNIKGLRKLQQVLQQRNQSPGTTALPISSSGAGATVTPKPLKDLRQRTKFSVRADGDKNEPGINDVKLLPGGLFVVTDGYNSCLKLFNIQGKMLHCLSCNHWPGCLEVLDTSSTSSTLAVTLPVGQAIDILEVTNQSIQVKKSLKVNERYRALAAMNNKTLAVGYFQKPSDVDIINWNGQLLSRISSVSHPWRMISTKNSVLIFSNENNKSIVKVNSSDRRVIFDIKVPQIANPKGINILSDDSLLVADLYTLSLHLVSSGGRWLKQVWTAPSPSAKDDKLRVHNKMILCFKARNPARTPVVGLKPATDGYMQISKDGFAIHCAISAWRLLIVEKNDEFNDNNDVSNGGDDG